MTDLNSEVSFPDATKAIIAAAGQSFHPEIEQLRQPFLRQSLTIRSIVAVGCDAVPDFAPNGPSADLSKSIVVDRAGGSWIDVLARQTCELFDPLPGDDLLVCPVSVLADMMTPVDEEFSFRVVAALVTHGTGEPNDESAWKLRRNLFDRGLIYIGSSRFGRSKALCFVATDAVQSLADVVDDEFRGHISITVLTDGARFANQLFRYAFVKLYALRHGLKAMFPDWEGKELFRLTDGSCQDIKLPMMTFAGFSDEDRKLWDLDDPPIDLDVAGYFQEIPECWRRHRPLLRRMFQLAPEKTTAIDEWREAVTDNGRRTLVAIHVRRGDYRELQTADVPWLRIVPEQWYLHWLRAIWPTLRDPILYVATDEPDAILPIFQEFKPLHPEFPEAASSLPGHIRDFEVMRRVDYLAICNSSFSRMAAILAPDTQQCFIPSFSSQSFRPYEPWIDPGFWNRFANSWSAENVRERRRQPSAMVMQSRKAGNGKHEGMSIFFDVTDLLFYLLDHPTLSGIQRVQCEILRNLPRFSDNDQFHFVVVNRHGKIGMLEGRALFDILEQLHLGTSSGRDIKSEVGVLLNLAVPCAIPAGDVFVSLGAFWNIQGVGTFLQRLKNSGVIIGIFLHDLLPIISPEFFVSSETRTFVKAVSSALVFANFVLTTSQFNKSSLAAHMASQKLPPLPVHVVPLGHALSHAPETDATLSSAVSGILDQEYVLCVGTIEVRKNLAYLFNIWKLMLNGGRPKIPYLVLVGRKGWMIQDFLDQLKSCGYLGGRILVLHDVTDVELEQLYRSCLFTVFPSFVEGWGLPVGESLAYGKICICSDGGGIPEVAGRFADYIDPYNANSGRECILRYLDDPELRRRREYEIATQFVPRLWCETTDDILRSVQGLARQARPAAGVAAITLPQGQYLAVGAAADSTETSAALSTELICVSGWELPDASGVRAAAEPSSLLRFRASAPVGSRINLLLRFAAHGNDFRIQLRSGSGAETVADIAAGSEKMVVLPCEVEPDKLVTARLSTAGSTAARSANSYWIFKGVLYFDPKNVAARAFQKLTGVNGSASKPAISPPPSPVQPECAQEAHLPPERVRLVQLGWDDRRRASSFGVFLQSSDCFWPTESITDRDAPIFADREDRRRFYSGCGDIKQAPPVGAIADSIKLSRRSNQFVSMSRFSEGSVFDHKGASKAFGYLTGSPDGHAPWLSKDSNGYWLETAALDRAPRYKGSYFVFYNGNLHNYYHWLVEGLLCLDIMSQALGRDASLKIALPKTMDINAVFDHRESLRDTLLDRHEILEVAENLIHVEEAIWIESDPVQTMPAAYIKDFQKRIAAHYARFRGPRNRRLLVARKGPTRKIDNVEQVQTFLSRYDFETVYLEGMSMRDQILLFQSAEFIISPHGAGLSNLLFCEPGTKVIELSPSCEIRPFFWIISEKLGLVHGLQFCDTVGALGFQSAIRVDLEKLQALIRMVDAHF